MALMSAVIWHSPSPQSSASSEVGSTPQEIMLAAGRKRIFHSLASETGCSGAAEGRFHLFHGGRGGVVARQRQQRGLECGRPASEIATGLPGGTSSITLISSRAASTRSISSAESVRV